MNKQIKSKEEILKDNGIYAGFSSTYSYDGILKSMEDYLNQSVTFKAEEKTIQVLLVSGKTKEIKVKADYLHNDIVDVINFVIGENKWTNYSDN